MAGLLDAIKRTPRVMQIISAMMLIGILGMGIAMVMMVKSSSGCRKEGTTCIHWWKDSAGNIREHRCACSECPC